MTILVNPGGPEAFGQSHVILSGRGSRRSPIVRFRGPLSVKASLEGRIDWRTSDGRLRVSPDTFALINEDHEYSLSTEEGACRTFCVFFASGFVERAVSELVEGPGRLLDGPAGGRGFGFTEALTPVSSPAGQALAALARAVREGAPAESLDWLLHALAGCLARAALEERARADRLSSVRAATREEIHRRLRRARAAVEDDLAETWTLEKMARAAAMAPHHFARSFAQCYGETPHGFLARRRLERADALIGSGRLSVTQACYEAGYRSLGSFSSAFSARFGRPPSSARPAGSKGESCGASPLDSAYLS